ncbi:pro-neuregulin-4, membrane-bound isoform isoform X7 [Ornithorhynchus anatinus]|uniref:pro-neuregulin-4, membrane-bound isoform isoform X7 n=1 Tax=Ornithorhynchus anatinus TaxID=9258 RepID=UPI0010A87D7D|nr:pro-neuregulin-4, membrane-bound isoform isoform X7 [Ornithorhynchus anatinus]XP_028921707.1 pro-neuregulin-4, membrane-bound isoform isoform X7 [Ornithorhynchus anatinus]
MFKSLTRQTDTGVPGLRGPWALALQSFPSEDSEQQPRCIENYTGARCEEVFLPSTNIQTKSELFATFLALAILLGVLTIGAVYFLCRKGHLQRANSTQYGVGLVETGSSSAYNNSDEDLVFQEDKTFSPVRSHSSLQDLNVQDRRQKKREQWRRMNTENFSYCHCCC